MAACVDIKEDLKAYVDGELGNGRRSAVSAHVDGCPQCARELAEIERYSNTLRALDNAQPRPELRRRILASLPEETAPVRRRAPWVFPAWAATAAAAALAGYFFYRPAAPPDSLRQTASVPEKGIAQPANPESVHKVPKKIALNDIKPDQSAGKSKQNRQQPPAPGPNVELEGNAAPKPEDLSAYALPVPITGHASGQPDAYRDVRRHGHLNRAPSIPALRPTEPEAPPALHDQMDMLLKAPAEKTVQKPAGAQADKREGLAEAGATILGVTAAKQATDADGTLVLMVDNLDSGLANVQTLAREQGGTSHVLQKLETAAQGINLQVTLPADRVEALKSKLSEGNSVRYFSVATPFYNQFGYQEQTTNSATFGRAGLGAGGGFGGGGLGATPAQSKAPAGPVGGSRGVVKGQVDYKKEAQQNAIQQQVAGKNLQSESIDRANVRKGGAAPSQQNVENKLNRNKLDNNVKLQYQNAGGRDAMKDETANNTRMLKTQTVNKPAPMFRLYIQLQQNPKTEPKSGGKAGN